MYCLTLNTNSDNDDNCITYVTQLYRISLLHHRHPFRYIYYFICVMCADPITLCAFVLTAESAARRCALVLIRRVSNCLDGEQCIPLCKQTVRGGFCYHLSPADCGDVEVRLYLPLFE